MTDHPFDERRAKYKEVKSMSVVGYLVMTNHWFEGDQDITKSFTFTSQDGITVDYNAEFREHWLTAIKPKYRSIRKITKVKLGSVEGPRLCNLDYFDLKSNYERRDHSFCGAICRFFDDMRRYCRGDADYAPLLVLKTGHNPLNGLEGLLKIQNMWAAKRYMWYLRADPEHLFDPRLTEKERMIRIQKAGIDPETVRLMC